MKTFNEKREEAKNEFFMNYNFLYAKDFLYDFLNDKLIPCDEKRSSSDSFVSFKEYATAFDTDDIFALIEEEYSYDGTKESFHKFVQRVSKIFDDWFEKFYNNVTNTNYSTTLCGEYIHAEYEGLGY